MVTSVADNMKGQLKQLEDERLALGRDTARWDKRDPQDLRTDPSERDRLASDRQISGLAGTDYSQRTPDQHSTKRNREDQQ